MKQGKGTTDSNGKFLEIAPSKLVTKPNLTFKFKIGDYKLRVKKKIITSQTKVEQIARHKLTVHSSSMESFPHNISLS